MVKVHPTLPGPSPRMVGTPFGFLAWTVFVARAVEWFALPAKALLRRYPHTVALIAKTKAAQGKRP